MQTTVPVTSRDSFITDPFFLAARQTLENSLLELTQKHLQLKTSFKEAEQATFHCATPCCCCCCCPAVSRLGNWAPAALIPCILCSSDQLEPQHRNTAQTHTIPDAGLCVPAGKLSFNTSCFELVLDVNGFQPSEIKVSVKDNFIEVNAEHQDFNQTLQSVVKRYKLPYPVNTDMVQCSLSKDGVLFLTAPWKC